MTACSGFASVLHATILARLINFTALSQVLAPPVFKITACDLEARLFRGIQLQSKVLRKPLGIALDGLIQRASQRLINYRC